MEKDDHIEQQALGDKALVMRMFNKARLGSEELAAVARALGGLRIDIRAGDAELLRAIADNILTPLGYEWTLIEMLDGPPELAIIGKRPVGKEG